ncbi:MAG TPA: LacI family DNA-binding transcriptional regulator [Dictyoglomaceae bacterium]|nr:LacI family DNA-binding transcriptional regulator [Dictyoglomaceae bacterium]HOL39307.1 LacI family DNA-binding transcriptional regulator [Dictyoglomaceae bacterium]HOP95040.1 LacI family DNA-binding transcriptional regulator [Dictyoglomaceae bacterium]HPP16011.1 LacI family DNA-binding transcriptional regulator [Dictyoglomaceae bacterium]HPU42968.1 LacI family DNA-binding transcriptional regulator [Dictyoglomaceae bacterium]
MRRGNNKRKVTLKDIAKAAEVSVSAVSFALNNKGSLNPETKTKILKVAQELGYIPEKEFKKTYTIGLVISDVTNPFYPAVITGVESVLLKHEYSLFLCNTDYDPNLGCTSIKRFIDRNVDGAIIMTNRLDDSTIELLKLHNIPVVVFDRSIEGLDVSGLLVDFQSGISEAVTHLVNLGHTDIAIITGPLDLETAQARLRAFKMALKRYHIELSEDRIVEGDFKMKSGEEAMRKVLKMDPRPTAVFVSNDMMAIGALREAQNQGVKVPEEISIVGLDDIMMSSYVNPPLTTVVFPQQEVGSKAAELILKYIEHGEKIVSYIHTYLVVRKSTGPAPR